MPDNRAIAFIVNALAAFKETGGETAFLPQT
jgi:hypothetical protein